MSKNLKIQSFFAKYDASLSSEAKAEILAIINEIEKEAITEKKVITEKEVITEISAVEANPVKTAKSRRKKVLKVE